MTATYTIANESQWRVRQINVSVIYRFNQQLKKRGLRNNDDFGDDDEFDG